MNSDDFISYLGSKSCVFWDWNGTLLDDTDYSLSVTNSIFKDYKLSRISKEEYLEKFTIPVYDYYLKLNLKDDSELSFAKISELFLKRYSLNRNALYLHKGAQSCLKTLLKNNIPQVLFSAAHIDELKFQIKHHSISEFFEIVSGADDIYAGSKLERGMALKSEYNFTNGVMVGDTLHDMEIGKEMGFETVWVSEGHQSVERAQGQSFIDYILDRRENNFYCNS